MPMRKTYEREACIIFIIAQYEGIGTKGILKTADRSDMGGGYPMTNDKDPIRHAHHDLLPMMLKKYTMNHVFGTFSLVRENVARNSAFLADNHAAKIQKEYQVQRIYVL